MSDLPKTISNILHPVILSYLQWQNKKKVCNRWSGPNKPPDLINNKSIWDYMTRQKTMGHKTMLSHATEFCNYLNNLGVKGWQQEELIWFSCFFVCCTLTDPLRGLFQNRPGLCLYLCDYHYLLHLSKTRRTHKISLPAFHWVQFKVQYIYM